LAELTKDQKKYSELLQGLILQGLLQLMEDQVTVTARSTDVQIVQQAAQAAERSYTDKSGRKTKVTVQEGLSEKSHGGVLLSGHHGRININQTLDERLRLLEDKMLPEIRTDLFGGNENRKFFD
jgi:V-type H+-transporting ATPase subunit E